MSVLQLTQQPGDVTTQDHRLRTIDVYALETIDLARYTGILIDGGCDQRYLASRRDQLHEWLTAGGRLVANGHPILRWLDGMPAHRKLDFHTPADLWLYPVADHQIFDGIDRSALIFRTGVPGNHSLERLQEIGVAGFYAHAYLTDMPPGAKVITGIGPGRLPVDVAWPIGHGELVLHIGNDLSSFTVPDPAEQLSQRVLTYLEGQ